MERSISQAPREEHSTGELVKMMTEQVSVLSRDELKLAQLEMTSKGKQAALGAGMFGAGGVGPLRRGLPAGVRDHRHQWRRGGLAGCAHRRRGPAGRRGPGRAPGQAAHEQGHASASRAGRSRRQGRCRGDQGKGAPMSTPESTPQTTPEEIQREIEQTRERLGETVEELAAKADVKTRAQAKVADVKARARIRAAEASERVRRNQAVRRDWPLALVAAGILVMGAALAWKRRTTT